VVMKMIADMICGPAIIVMARGRISRLMVSSHSAGCHATLTSLMEDKKPGRRHPPTVS
jgi:hypothetical protein